MKKTYSLAILCIAVLSLAFSIGVFHSIQPTYGVTPDPLLEPTSLQDLVEFPEAPGDTSIVPADNPVISLEAVTSTPDWGNVTEALAAKGYTFDLATATIEDVSSSSMGGINGYLVSAWSTEMGQNGTRAFIMGMYEFRTATAMVVGGITNLLPAEQVPEVDPFIIVNAMPYVYVQWYWYAWNPVARVITWSYWWYDSHSHPNWFWGCYWYWRTYVSYYLQAVGVIWQPWWWWFWHIAYWRHWHWWSTYFPY